MICLQTLSIVDNGFGHGGISFRPGLKFFFFIVIEKGPI